MQIGDIVTIDGEQGQIIAIGNGGGSDNVSVRLADRKVWVKMAALAQPVVEDKAVDGPKRGRKTSK